MRLFRGDVLARLTFGSPLAAVVYEEERVPRSRDEATVERLYSESDGATVATVTKLVRRPWRNHLLALGWGIVTNIRAACDFIRTLAA